MSVFQMFLQMFILIIKSTPAEGVDYVGFAVPVVSLMLPPVGHMHMAVDKKTGLIFVHQRIKNLKSLVRQIPPVVQLIGGRMRQ